jgi:hypothetical protein
MGCDDARATYHEALSVSPAIGEAIIAARATTLLGLVVRAGIVTALIGDDDEPDHLMTEEKMMQAIVRDLVPIAI